jgi:putative membrane protein
MSSKDRRMTYEIIKSLHIISVVAWMAGMLYLPRLFVYHTQVQSGSEASELFKVMERRLLRFIINPAMILTWIFGIWLAVELDAWTQGWLHTKLTLVLLLSAVHGMLAGHMKQFAADRNTKSKRYYKLLNEAPTVLLIVIVFLVVLKPF